MGKCATVFKDIGKTCNDLLTKDYKVGKNTVELKSKASNGVTFTPSGTNAGGKVSGSLIGKYAFGGTETEATLNTSGVINATTETADFLTKGLTLTLEAERPEPGKAGFLSTAKCELEYKQEAMSAKGSYDFYSGALLASGSTAFQAFTFGASADYSTAKSALSKYAGALQFVQPDFTVMAKLAANVGKGSTYTGTYYHKVSSDMQVGAELTKATNKADVGLSFGCAYKLDKDTSVKGKVDSEGIMCASYKQKVSSLTSMTLAAQIDTVNLTDNKHKFGMILNLTP